MIKLVNVNHSDRLGFLENSAHWKSNSCVQFIRFISNKITQFNWKRLNFPKTIIFLISWVNCEQLYPNCRTTPNTQKASSVHNIQCVFVNCTLPSIRETVKASISSFVINYFDYRHALRCCFCCRYSAIINSGKGSHFHMNISWKITLINLQIWSHLAINKRTPSLILDHKIVASPTFPFPCGLKPGRFCL